MLDAAGLKTFFDNHLNWTDCLEGNVYCFPYLVFLIRTNLNSHLT